MSRAGPLGAFGAVALRPASWTFGAAVALRNARFDRGAGVRRLPIPVISIGNLTVGGTGKTPMVAHVVDLLRRAGHRPAIAMRGYAARPGETSDEAREYAVAVPGTSVIADPDRYAAVSRFLAQRPDAIDCAVLDDGFQHRALARDLDVVLVDATRPALDGPLLPAGWLREPASGLRRASAVVVTRADRVDEALARRIAELHGRPPIAWCRHAWRGVSVHARGAVEPHDVAWLRGKRVLGVFGVGNPSSVRAEFERAGATVVVDAAVGDHARHSARDLARWAARVRGEGLDAIVTTRKDWSKLAPLASRETPTIVVPELAIEFTGGEAEFSRLVLDSAESRR
ncbi:MAG: tetraacyldisaccharide 4'-kinase [Phycisphaerales bacterium]